MSDERRQLYEIKSCYDGSVLFSLECESLKVCVEAAVKARADLTDADLTGADLAGADLRGANLARADLRGADLRGASLAGAYLAGANLAGANLVRANLARANLAGASLAGASLAGAYLAGANLAGADLIDAGQDRRGFRFWAWRDNSGVVVYRGGCHTWTSIDKALAWYGDSYSSNGDRAECIARLTFLRDEATRRWPAAELNKEPLR